MLYNIFRLKKLDVRLVGNIGKPPLQEKKIKQNIVKNKTTSTSNPMFFALSSSQQGVSSLTINLILITSVTVLLALPTLFLLRSGKGKSAF